VGDRSCLLLNVLWGFPGHDRMDFELDLGAASTSRGASSHTNTTPN
jgi:hypothetical protein